MNDHVIFKGTNSLDVGLIVTELPEILLPEERVTFTSVPGKSGTLTQREGDDVFNDVTLTVTCYIRRVTEEAVAAISAYFRGSGQLRLPNRPNGYYEATVVNQIPFSKILRGKAPRTFPVNFRCKPLFRLDAGDVPTPIAASGDFILNPTNIRSKPLIQLSGSGDITLMVGTQIIELTGIEDGISLDSEYQEAYSGEELQNDKMSGEFPVLVPGNNAITWTGTVTGVTITPRWVTL